MKKKTKKKTNIARALLIIIGIVLSGIYIFPTFIYVNIATFIGVGAGIILVLCGIFLDKIIGLCKMAYKSKRGKILLNSFFAFSAVAILLFSVALGSVIACSGTNADGQSTVIVLGCFSRGEKPGYTLKQRLNGAYDYLVENPEASAVLAGGQGRNEKISEALCMYNYLVEKGIEPERLYMEDKSTNTNENIAFSKKIIEENNLSPDVAIASSDYHLKRATMIAKKNGLNATRISGGSVLIDKPNFYLREVLGVVKEFVF